MRQYIAICDKCKRVIEKRKVWVLTCPLSYTGIDYDLCFDCVNGIMGLSKSSTPGDTAERMARDQYASNQGY